MTLSDYVLFLDERSFDVLRLDEADQFLVDGRGDRFRLINLPDMDHIDVFAPKPEGMSDFKDIGIVGVMRDGMIAASYLMFVSDPGPLVAAAVFLAASELATTRRAEANKVHLSESDVACVEWLNTLAALEDPRPESGAANAQTL